MIDRKENGGGSLRSTLSKIIYNGGQLKLWKKIQKFKKKGFVVAYESQSCLQN